MDNLSDEELMALYQQDDEPAFAQLYARHSSRVYGFLVNSLRDKAMADDVFQATFMKLHKSRLSYDTTFPFIPWLFTVTRGVMVDHLRKAGRIREKLDTEAVDGAVAPEHEPEQSSEMPSLAGLQPAQRKAIELRYGQDLSFEEIAKKLETSPMNARQLVSRAVKKLRAVL